MKLYFPPPSTSIAIFAQIILLQPKGVHTIGCYVCHSFDGDDADPSCEDTFNTVQSIPTLFPNGSTQADSNYHGVCWGYRKDRKGYFPADSCIKIKGKRKGYLESSKDTDGNLLRTPPMNVTIRTCSLDSGSLTADTEIVRMSHCGQFEYEGGLYDGCVLSCDKDGCNGVSKMHPSTVFILLLCSLTSFLIL